jgi:ribonuclease HI
VIYKDEEKIWECSKINGQGSKMSNNVAEYAALIAVLEWFIEQESLEAEILVKGDSQLVINQMFRTWKIKEGLYIELAHRARELLSRFKNIRGEWISRDHNEVADGLSKAALKRADVELKLQPA